MNYEKIIALLTALLTPTIAILGLYIAYQQWETNERKRKQDLYDKRCEFYFAVLNKIHEIEKTLGNDDNEISDIENHANIIMEKSNFLISKKDMHKIDNLILWARGVEIKSVFEQDKCKKKYFKALTIAKDKKDFVAYRFILERKKATILHEIDNIFEKYLRIEKSFVEKCFPFLNELIENLTTYTTELDDSECQQFIEIKKEHKSKLKL